MNPKTERRMLQAAERLAGVGHWRLDLVTNDLFWSDEVFRIHGYEPGEITPDLDFAIDVYHPDERARVRRVVERAIDTGLGWTFTCRLVHRNGSLRQVSAKGEVELGADGQVVALFGVFQDHTTELEERAQLERLQSIIESTCEGVVITDRDGRLTWCNQGFARMTGYALSELQGRRPGRVFRGPGTCMDTVREMNQHIARGEPYTCELLNYRKSGQPYWVRMSLHPRRTDDGQIEGYFAIESDITQMRQVMEDMRTEIFRREQLEADLRALATEDPLSKLSNRRGFFERAEQEIQRAREHGSSVSLGIIDIDHFKQVNDTYGHQAGDAVIRHLGHLMRELFREQDVIGRIGGEEFALLLPDTDLQGASILIRRFREILAAKAVRHAGTAIPVRCSVGLGELARDETITGLLSRADDALYEAKHAGRDRVVLARAQVIDLGAVTGGERPG